MAFRLRVKLAHSELPKRLWKFDPDWTFESFSEFKEEIFKAGVGKELYEVILERAYKSWDRVDQFSGIGEVELYFGEIDGNVIIDDYEQFVEVLEKDDLLTVAVSAEMLALVKDPANALLAQAKQEITNKRVLGANKKSSFIKQEPVAVAAGSSSINSNTGSSSSNPFDLTGMSDFTKGQLVFVQATADYTYDHPVLVGVVQRTPVENKVCVFVLPGQEVTGFIRVPMEWLEGRQEYMKYTHEGKLIGFQKPKGTCLHTFTYTPLTRTYTLIHRQTYSLFHILTYSLLIY